MDKINSIKDLKVYNISYKSAMEIFWLTKKFPKEELFSLVNQICRASRSVPANIREGFTKRKYRNVFIKHLIDAWGSSLLGLPKERGPFEVEGKKVFLRRRGLINENMDLFVNGKLIKPGV